MKSKLLLIGALPAVLAIASFESLNSQQAEDPTLRLGKDLEKSITETAGEGRQTFRFDTFGDESFWGDTLHLHQAIAGARFGGIGPRLSPLQALAVGLKVDQDAFSTFCVVAGRRTLASDDKPSLLRTLSLRQFQSYNAGPLPDGSTPLQEYR